MSVKGNIKDMAIADIIQTNCHDRKSAKLTVKQNGAMAELFFHNGQVVHASYEDQIGAEVVYQALYWDEGDFTLESDIDPPNETIQQSWSALLLEGARRLDEFNQEATHTKEANPMADKKKKGEILAEALTGLLEESTDIAGAAIVGIDGLVYSANVPQKELDEDLVGAASAAVFGLSTRSVGQLKRGSFVQTLIQGDKGNIIVRSLDQNTILIGLTAQNVNLGMAFAEVRTMSESLSGII